jgi:hypothetical protein
MKNRNLSREDIDCYRSTNSERLRHAMEEKSLGDSFNADALDGWDAPEMASFSMKRLDKHFIQSYKWLAVSGGGVLLLGVLVAWWLGLGTNNTPRTVPSVSRLHVLSNDSLVHRFADGDSIYAKFLYPKNASRVYERNSIENHTELENEREVEDISELPLKQLKLYWEKYPGGMRAIDYKGTEFYLYDLKLLDYRVYRVEMKVYSNELVLSGTPASVGDGKQVEHVMEGENVGVPYIDYLDKTMKAFSKGDHAVALSRCLVILGDYPDDVNALFYGGLCYYYLGNWKNAALLFDRVGTSTYSNFREEAEWYLAKSWLKGDEVDKGKGRGLLNDIIQANGYYAKDAWELLTH